MQIDNINREIVLIPTPYNLKNGTRISLPMVPNFFNLLLYIKAYLCSFKDDHFL